MPYSEWARRESSVWKTSRSVVGYDSWRSVSHTPWWLKSTKESTSSVIAAQSSADNSKACGMKPVPNKYPGYTAMGVPGTAREVTSPPSCEVEEASRWGGEEEEEEDGGEEGPPVVGGGGGGSPAGEITVAARPTESAAWELSERMDLVSDGAVSDGASECCGRCGWVWVLEG